MIMWGTPNLTIIFSLMKFVIAPPMALRSGTASAHLVKYSVATSIHMYPRNGGLTYPTRSSPQVWKGHGVTILRKFCEWVWIKLAYTWQLRHFFHKFCRISFYGRPVVAHLQQASVKPFLPLVLPTLSWVYFFYHFSCFFRTQMNGAKLQVHSIVVL